MQQVNTVIIIPWMRVTLGLRQLKETERKASLPNMPWKYHKASQNSLWHLQQVFSWQMSYFQPTLTLHGTQGKSSTNSNQREKSKLFCIYIWTRVNFISRVCSWDDLFPLRLSICFWTGWQANDSGPDSSISCRNRTGESCVVSPLDNELDFWMQPRFLQDKPWCDRLVLDEATQPKDFLYPGSLPTYLLYIVQRRQEKSCIRALGSAESRFQLPAKGFPDKPLSKMPWA